MKHKRNKIIYPVLLLSAVLIFFSLTENCSTVTGVVEKKEPQYRKPFRGLYIPIKYYNNKDFVRNIITKGRLYGINMLVLDIHRNNMKTLIDRNVMKYLREKKIYAAARVVCFPDGLSRLPVPVSRLQKIYQLIRNAADAGFQEAQLDYIRFKDIVNLYTLRKKYDFIEEFLKEMRSLSSEKNIKLSADLFGRVVFNQNDNIGQKLEIFAKYTDVVYPMLYPSHFIDNTRMMSNPGKTVKDGVMRGLKRLRGTGVELQPYIQSFRYNIQWARMSLEKYVKLQIDAVEETGARGWVAWNAGGNYDAVFNALERKEEK